MARGEVELAADSIRLAVLETTGCDPNIGLNVFAACLAWLQDVSEVGYILPEGECIYFTNADTVVTDATHDNIIGVLPNVPNLKTAVESGKPWRRMVARINAAVHRVARNRE